MDEETLILTFLFISSKLSLYIKLLLSPFLRKSKLNVNLFLSFIDTTKNIDNKIVKIEHIHIKTIVNTLLFFIIYLPLKKKSI